MLQMLLGMFWDITILIKYKQFFSRHIGDRYNIGSVNLTIVFTIRYIIILEFNNKISDKLPLRSLFLTKEG